MFIYKNYSAPEKPFTYQDCHRVGAFVQHFTDNKHNSDDDVPFLSLLQQVKLDRYVYTDHFKYLK
jgi:hypothetical protein